MSFVDFLPLPITALGVFFLIKLGFFPLLHPLKTAGEVKEALKNPESRGSLALALAGTLGIGNIAGVAYGLSVGGAGSLFWLLISAVFASVIKYAESALSAEFRDTGHGGMMYVIAATLKRGGRAVARIYAVLCLLLSLTMGSALQAESVAGAFEYTFGINAAAFTLLFSGAVLPVIICSSKRIESVTSVVIPLSTIIYIIICLSVIFLNISRLPAVICEIFSSAFSPKSAAGGIFGFISARALREGFARGMLSNEAGAGTSAAAQTRAAEQSSHRIGLLGMSEVFFDTALLCMLTGLAVLLSGVPLVGSGMEIALAAIVDSLGTGSAVLLFILVFCFAYSTVICWYFYGSECVTYLSGKRRSALYTVLFSLSLLLVSHADESVLISASDIILFLMCLITLFTLFKNSERIVHLSEPKGY